MKEGDNMIRTKLKFYLLYNEIGEVVKICIYQKDHYCDNDVELGYVDDPISIKYYMDNIIKKELRKEKLKNIL